MSMTKWLITNQKEILIDLLKSNSFELHEICEENTTLKFNNFIKKIKENTIKINSNDLSLNHYNTDKNEYVFDFEYNFINKINIYLNLKLEMNNDKLQIILFD